MAESSVKKLHSNASQNMLLHQALYNKTLQAVKNTGLPFILVDEVLQKGNNFGEKYCNALEHCYSKGFEKIISIGTDCATLTTDVLLNANTSSFSNNLIGADNNGGFFLFALHRKNYNRQHFSKFNWCSNDLLKDIFSYFTNANLAQPTLIQTEKDINSTIDLIEVIKQKNASLFLKLLFQLFNKLKTVTEFVFIKIDRFFLRTFLLRGPPSMVAVTI